MTNPGNTPLANVVLTDDKCAPVRAVPAAAPDQAYNIGDLNRNERLDVTETWQAFCERDARASAGRLAGVSIVNTATVQGTDPAGTVVSATDSDDVQIFVPRIQLTKLVDGQDSVTVESGTEVSYTYAVVNTGDTPLQPVTLTDDTAPCQSPTLTPPADGDTVLAVGETWNYTCVASPAASVLNTATVSGVPLDPTTGAAFPTPNPPVTDIDTAKVDTVDPDLALTKSVDKSVVFPGTTAAYTYTAFNDGTSDLRNDTGTAGWVADDSCAPVQQVLVGAFNTGDVNTDTLLNPGESWQFTCQTAISVPTLNRATIVAQPVAGGAPVGGVLTRTALAFVGRRGCGDRHRQDGTRAGRARPRRLAVRRSRRACSTARAVSLRGVQHRDRADARHRPRRGPVRERRPRRRRPRRQRSARCGRGLDVLLRDAPQRSQGTPPPVGAESGVVTNPRRSRACPSCPRSRPRRVRSRPRQTRLRRWSPSPRSCSPRRRRSRS